MTRCVTAHFANRPLVILLTEDVPGVRAFGQIGVGRMRLPSESVGIATVTFAGIQPGTEIRVYLPDATEVAGIESCAENQVLVWPAYAVGSLNNTVRIVLMHTNFKLKEFSYSSTQGAQTLPIQQDRDQWYSNP